MTTSFLPPHMKDNIMILSGQGEVFTDPNLAIIRLGVQTTGDNLATTQMDNARTSQAVLNTFKQMGITDIKTYQYLIEKIYDYENGDRIDKGYAVRNIFEIRFSNLDEVGLVIDSAVNNGANVVEFISFDVSNSEVLYQQALNLAVLNAIQKAESISKQFGLPLNLIPTRIVENTFTAVPFPQFDQTRERAFATPIEPGQKSINASVQVEFTY